MSYRALIAPLPVPTPEQTGAFAIHVAENHSWYKHLPFFPPAARFTFFLNPHAGREVREAGAGFRAIDLDEGDYFRHHSRYSTARYRERFGHWDYWVYNPLAFGAVDGPWLYSASGRERLPDDLTARWSCQLTAFVRRGPLLRAHRFEDEMRQFVAHARRHPDAPHVPRYLELVDAIGAATAARREAVIDTFAKAEEPVLHQTVLQALFTARGDVARG